MTIPRTGDVAEAIEASLRESGKRLQRDVLDVVQIHNATLDVLRRGEVTVALQAARQNGTVRFLGASVYTVDEALAVLDDGRFDVLQVAFNILDQRMADRVFPAARRAGVGVLVRSAFLKGVLTDKARHLPPKLNVLQCVAEKVKDTVAGSWEAMPEVALRFCLSADPASAGGGLDRFFRKAVRGMGLGCSQKAILIHHSITPVLHHSITPRILITMGGSDPAGLTLKAVRALRSLSEPFKAVVLLGPGFLHERELEKELAVARPRFAVKRNVSNVARLMRKSDVAVASFGVTAYELAAMGVPAIYLCLTDDHAESASALSDAGMGVNLGLHSAVSETKLADTVIHLLNGEALRSSMSHRAQSLVDGCGAERVAQLIADQCRISTLRRIGSGRNECTPPSCPGARRPEWAG